SHHNDRPDVQVRAFIDRMDYAYQAADWVISRAGASSVSELCLVGKPTLFIPSPNVAEDHQAKNARAIVDKSGALMLPETELDEKFQSTLSRLATDEEQQSALSQNIKKLARPNATADIADEVEKIINARRK